MKKGIEEFRRKFNARVFGKFIFTSVVNGVGAPFIDKCVGQTETGKSWRGWAVQINPFNFNKNGDRKEGKCFVVGIIHS